MESRNTQTTPFGFDNSDITTWALPEGASETLSVVRVRD